MATYQDAYAKQFKAVDPTKQWATGDAMWGEFKGATGLGDEWLDEAKKTAGYASGPVTGAQWNTLGKEFASRTPGWGFQDWQAPPPPEAGPSLDLTVPDAPGLTLDRLTKPDPFMPKDFVAPTADAALNDPGYKFALDQSIGALENSASASGMTRHPNARQAIIAKAGDMASQRYQDVYDRQFKEWGAGEDARANAYLANFGVDQTATSANNDATVAEYDPSRATWEARLLAGDKNIDRAWQREVFGKDAAFRDKAFDANEYWRNRDDWWRGEDQALNLKKFLAQMGLA
jgi:hypothetical protein